MSHLKIHTEDTVKEGDSAPDSGDLGSLPQEEHQQSCFCKQDGIQLCNRMGTQGGIWVLR